MTAAPDSKLATLWCPSPNRDQRANGRAPDMLILHYTGMESSDAALDWLTREEAKVSAHYLVDEEGRIAQMVAESERAWHAGQSRWAGETDLNSCSIGIEIHNPATPFRQTACLPTPTLPLAESATPARSSIGKGLRGPASGFGSSRRRLATIKVSAPVMKGKASPSSSAHFSNTAMGWKSPRPMALVSRRWSKPSSAISGPHGSMAAQICRPVTRWRACSMLGSQTRQPEGKALSW
jgi:hypothetical protein